jgi:hypothetical protein
MEAVAIVAFWSIVAWTLSRPAHALIYLFFASLPFGSFAAVPTSATGGLTLTPTTVAALLLIARRLGSARGLARALDAALTPSTALLLTLFWAVAGIATLFMPRFFAGRVPVVNVALAEVMTLRPTAQNVSQFVYISISVLVVLAFADLLRTASARRHALHALCLGAEVAVVTGFVDFLSQYLPMEGLLDPLRTANYALLTTDEILDSKRVVGLMPEASSFGCLVLAFLVSLYFFRRAMPAGRVRERVVPALMGALLLLGWLSTSSAAYLGLGAFGAVAVAHWCRRALAPGRDADLRHGLARELAWSVAVLWVLALAGIARPGLFDPIARMLDTMVLQKTATASYEERSMWTRVSWEALMATHGMGVGLGGTRASNSAVALASNAGLAGAACYFLFVFQCLFLRRVARADAQGRALRSALRWSFVPSFLASLTIGSTSDFGVFNAFLYALSIALARPMAPEPVRTPRPAASIAGPSPAPPHGSPRLG